MKRVLAFILAFCMIIPMVPMISSASEVSFEDFTEDHWAYNLQIEGFEDKNPILELAELGIIDGKEKDGKMYLCLDDKITKIDFLVLVLKARFGAEHLEYEASKAESVYVPYSDCSKHWAKKYLKVAKKYEILTNVKGNKFYPDSTITRQEMMALLLSNGAILPENITIKSGDIRYSDVSENSPYFEYINHAYQAGLISGPDGTFRPEDAGTRAEAMVIVAKYVGLMEKLEGKGAADNLYLTTSSAQVYVNSSAIITAQMDFPTGGLENVEWNASVGKIRGYVNSDGKPTAYWTLGDAQPDKTYRINFSADYVWTSELGQTQINPSTYTVEVKKSKTRVYKSLEITVREKPIPYIKKGINAALDKDLNVTGVLENGTLKLKWDDVDASRYRVEKSDKLGEFTEVKTLYKTEYDVVIGPETPSAYYRVVALNSSGEITDQTGVIEVACMLKAPHATMIETAQYTFVVWNKVCGAEYYIVQRKLKGEPENAFYDVSDKITDRCFIDESAGEDYKLYDYRVCAYNYVLATGVPSNSVNVDYELQYDESDFDKDGLSNLEELKNKTSPYVDDSDMDGIPDGIEMKTGSYAYISDSDGDTIDDGTEVLLGLNYLHADVFKKDCVATVTDSQSGVEASVEGYLNVGDEKLRVKTSTNPLLKTVGDLVAEPIELINRTGRKDVYITIPLPETDIYGKKVTANTIAAYAVDRETKAIVQLKDLTVDKKKDTVKVNTEGYSIIIFARESKQILECDFKEIDVIFTMDRSGSMSGSDPNRYRVQAATYMVERFDDTKRVGLVEFDSYSTIISEIDGDMERVKANISTMGNASGGTDIADGITKSAALFEDDARRHMIILLSDGQSSYSSSVNAAKAAANENVVINTIALGSGADEALLDEVAAVTGGNAFVITDKGSQSEILTQMNVIYNQIFGDISLKEYNKLSYDYLLDFLGLESILQNLGTSVYVYTDSDPADRLVIDQKSVQEVSSAAEAKNVIKNTIAAVDQSIADDSGVRDKVLLTAEESLSRASAKVVTTSTVLINDTSVEPIYKNIQNMISDVEKLLVEALQNPDREIRKVARYTSTTVGKINIDKDELTGDHKTLTEVVVQTPYVDVVLDTDQVTDLSVQQVNVPAAVDKIIKAEEAKNADDEDGSKKPSSKKRVAVKVDFEEENEESYISLALPGSDDGDAMFSAIVDENGTPVGGKYNPATGVVEAKITKSGIYTIMNNEKEFSDIKQRSSEVQEAIKVLASKGIINGTSEQEFSPENTISRAEVAAIIVRTLSKLDANADGGFADVTRENWFFGVAGSSKKINLINGYLEKDGTYTFRGNDTISKDQLLVVTARVLMNEMNYVVKDNEVDEYLGVYKDKDRIASWGKKEIALAAKVNLVMSRIDGTFTGEENMTRGDAAVVLYRLFKKLW